MDYSEELALSTAPVKAQLSKRYVDDTCCIVKKTIAELLDHLHGVRTPIKFSVEVKQDGTLPFLDTLLRRKIDGSLEITVYKRPTHTDRYLDFLSHHSPTSREHWSGTCMTGPRCRQLQR